MTDVRHENQACDDELSPDSEFESYFDRDSGAWSLRRIPTSPPQPHLADEENAS
jgi:hypothetical protein